MPLWRDSALLRENDMSGNDTGGGIRGMTGRESGNVIAITIDFLSLAAAPAFATMALLTAGLDGGPPEVLCAAAQHASPLSGMAPMYALMSAFHAAPWLKLISKPATSSRNDTLTGAGRT